MFFVFIIGFIYSIYVMSVTSDVMKMAKEVAAGEVIVESGTPYARFRPLGKKIYTRNIKRYFTYCGIKKGKIFVTCINVIDSDNGEEHTGRDWLIILIEKTKDGKWKAVGTVGEP